MYMHIHIQGGKEGMSYYKMKSVGRIKGGQEGVTVLYIH